MSAEPARSESEPEAPAKGGLRALDKRDPGFLKAVKSNVQRTLLSDDLDMPRMSSLASRIMHIAADPNVDVDKIVELVQADAFLAGKILKLINSAYFSTRQEITSLRHAIVLLGLKSVGDLIFSVSVKMKVFKCPPYEKLMGQLWENSVASAVATEVISQLRGKGNEPGFMAGLMHGIGKPIVLNAIVITEQSRMPGKNVGQDLTVMMLDRMYVQVGSLLAKKWKFSADIHEAIAHHATFEPESSNLAKYVYCGSRVARHLGFGYSQESITPSSDPGFEALRLTSDDAIRQVVDTTREHTGRLLRTF